MTVTRHLKLFLLVTLVWAFFWILGLPDYYQQYSIRAMLIFDGLLLLPIGGLLFILIKQAAHKMNHALWLAFYFTVPFFLYDYLYCGIYLKQGIGFVTSYWYLTLYYIIPWLLSPVIAFTVVKTAEKPGS